MRREGGIQATSTSSTLSSSKLSSLVSLLPSYISLTLHLTRSGLATATITIFIRSVYRCAELSGGFNSTLFTSDEALFMILEGLMIVIATTCLTVFHPAVCFQGVWHEANFTFRTKKGASAKLYSTDEENQFSDVRLEDVPLSGNQVFDGQRK